MGRRGTTRTSCDSCFSKKVKCDLGSKAAASTSVVQSCSYCLRHGLDCTFDGKGASSLILPGGSQSEALFGIAGLDRQTLDQSVQAYHSHDAICKPLAPPQLFLPRYHASFESVQDGSVQPASTMLILAVAACGVAWLERLGHQRFELQERIIEAMSRLASQPIEPHEALDKIEAIALVWDLESRHKIVAQHQPNPLVVHPLSDEAIVRLVLSHGLNTSAPTTTLRTLRDIHEAPSTSSGTPGSDGTSSHRSSQSQCREETDSLRRTILFWMCYADDALLRFESGRLPLIHEDEVDAPMLSADFGTPFYKDWIAALLSLAVVLRGASLHLCSARAKRLGLRPSSVLRFLADLEDWRRNLPAALFFEDGEVEGSARYEVVAPSSQPDRWAEMIQRAFLELTFYGLHSSTHILAAQVGFEEAQDKSLARSQLAATLLRALDSIVWRSSRCAQLGFLDYSNLVLRTIPRGCAYYSILLSDAALSQGLLALSEHLLAQSERLGSAISTLTSHPDAQAEAEELRLWQALRRGSRLGIDVAPSDEALKGEMHRFDGTSVLATSSWRVEASSDDDHTRARPFAFDASLSTDPAAYFERLLEEPVI